MELTNEQVREKRDEVLGYILFDIKNIEKHSIWNEEDRRLYNAIVLFRTHLERAGIQPADRNMTDVNKSDRAVDCRSAANRMFA